MYQILLPIRIENNHTNQIEWTTKTAQSVKTGLQLLYLSIKMFGLRMNV